MFQLKQFYRRLIAAVFGHFAQEFRVEFEHTRADFDGELSRARSELSQARNELSQARSELSREQAECIIVRASLDTAIAAAQHQRDEFEQTRKEVTANVSQTWAEIAGICAAVKTDVGAAINAMQTKVNRELQHQNAEINWLHLTKRDAPNVYGSRPSK